MCGQTTLLPNFRSIAPVALRNAPFVGEVECSRSATLMLLPVSKAKNMNSPSLSLQDCVSRTFRIASAFGFILGFTSPTQVIAQPSIGSVTAPSHPVLMDCQKRFREAAISAGSVFVQSTMTEVCSTVEQSCKTEAASGIDCQKAVANVGKHISASFSGREPKLDRAR